MPDVRFRKVDETTRQDHYYLQTDDECYFLYEYTAHAGWQHATNQLIFNLKKKLGAGGYHYKAQTGGHHTWTEDEITQYAAHHARGTKARLALALLLQTGHARADVARMGRQHVKNGKLSMRRQKTGVQFDIPVLPELVAELALHKSGQLAFLVTDYGQPFAAAGFGNKFRDWCNQANLPHCSAHGLRKAAAVRHALNGATAPELMAWFGWKSIGEAQRYIEEANRIKLAESAGAKMIVLGDKSGETL